MPIDRKLQVFRSLLSIKSDQEGFAQGPGPLLTETIIIIGLEQNILVTFSGNSFNAIVQKSGKELFVKRLPTRLFELEPIAALRCVLHVFSKSAIAKTVVCISYKQCNEAPFIFWGKLIERELQM